jgi:hypothetical protein
VVDLLRKERSIVGEKMNLQLHTRTSLPSATMIIVKPRQVLAYKSDLTKWTLTEAHHIFTKTPKTV